MSVLGAVFGWYDLSVSFDDVGVDALEAFWAQTLCLFYLVGLGLCCLGWVHFTPLGVVAFAIVVWLYAI